MHKYSKIRGILRAKQGSQIPKFFFGKTLELNPYKNANMQSQPQYEGLDSWRNIDIANIGQTSLTPDFNIGNTSFINSSLLQQVLKGDKSSIFTNIKGKIGNTLKNGIQKLGTDGIINGIDAGINLIGGQFNDLADNKISKWGNVGTSLLQNTGIINGPQALALKGLTAGLQGLDSLTGKNTIQMYVDQEANAAVGGSYQDSINGIAEAYRKAGVKHGGITGNKKRRADNAFINEYQRQQNIISGIAEDAQNQRAMVNDLNRIGYYNNINNVLDQRYMRSAKLGMKLQDKINFIKSRKFNQVINIDTRQVEEFKEGGKLTNTDWEPEIELFEEWEPVIELEMFQKGGKTRTLEELIEYAKKENPRFIQRLSESPHGIEFVDDEGNKGVGNVYLEWSTDDEGNAVIYPRIQEMEDRSLKFLSSDEAWKRANKNNNILIMSPEEAQIFFAEDSEYQTAYKRGWPEMFKNYSEEVKCSMKEGGKTKEELETPEIEETTQKNLIPEGALHKNKHHIEHTEGLTQKGIPVIDNDGEQQAEIELDEIIFTLEVTKKIEELYRDGSDEAAIEAGKLLVKEILFNTDDRTGLISKCEKGGKL